MNENRDRNGPVLAAIVFGIFAFFFGMHVANADMVAEDEYGTKMTLSNKPCTNGKIRAFAERSGAPVDLLTEGFVITGGKRIEGCWAVNPNDMVVMFLEDGRHGSWPKDGFKKLDGV
jgi:hypothetical protein